MAIEHATSADAPAIEALLADAGLPLDGAAAAFERGVVIRERGDLVAAAAVEQFGHAGLLRSVVVAPTHRGSGLGRTIVAAAEDLAREAGIEELYLVTETADAWFPRLGYAPIDRSRASEAVGESIEFTTVCRDRGLTFHRRLA